MKHYDKPLAVNGLISYRCKGAYGWIMIGAKNNEDAKKEAIRSSTTAKFSTLQMWDGKQYVDAS